MTTPAKSTKFRLSVAEIIPHNLLLHIQPIDSVVQDQMTELVFYFKVIWYRLSETLESN